MNKNQYVNSILKRLLATDRTKKRIRADLMTEIEALEDQGFSLEEIVRQKGAPELVAKEFNDSSSDPEAQRQYYLQRGLKSPLLFCLYQPFSWCSLVRPCIICRFGTRRLLPREKPSPSLAEPMAPPPFSSPVFPKSWVLPPSC